LAAGKHLAPEAKKEELHPDQDLSLAERVQAMKVKKRRDPKVIWLTERAIERRDIVKEAIDANPDVKWLMKMNGKAHD
jgi:hypothetical protein